MVKKRQVCFRIEEFIVKEMERLREETGVPVSTQIELRLKGYEINKSTLDMEADQVTSLQKDINEIYKPKLAEIQRLIQEFPLSKEGLDINWEKRSIQTQRAEDIIRTFEWFEELNKVVQQSI